MRKRRLFFIIIVFLCVLCSSFIHIKQANAEAEEKIIGTHFDLSTQIRLNDKTIQAVSTFNNLYLIIDQQIAKQLTIKGTVIHLVALDDINNNGYDDFIVMTTSQTSDNIIVYDSAEYSIIYSLQSQMKTFDEGRGYIDITLPIEDFVISGKQGIFAAGYTIFQLDLLTGEVLWKYTATNNAYDIVKVSDINSDHVEDYIVSLQTTNIVALSGATGEELYNLAVSEDVSFELKTYKTSIWSMQFDEATNSLYACSQNGKIYVVDVATFQIIHSKEIYKVALEDIEKYYTDPSFYKQLSIELIGDLNNDGMKDILYRQLTSEELRQSNLRTLHQARPAILFLSGKDLSSLPGRVELEMFNEKYYFRGIYNDLDVFYVLDNYSNYTSMSNFNIFSIQDNRFLEETFTLRTDLFIQFGGNNEHYALFKHNKLDTVTISKKGITFLSGNNVSKYIPLASTSDYLEHEDHLLIMNGNFSLNMHDMRNASQLWSYNLSQQELISNIYFVDVIFSNDYTNDDVADVVVFLSGSDDILPRAILLDGKTGNQLKSIDLAIPEEDIDVDMYSTFLRENNYYYSEIKDSGVYSDLNEDGIDELYVINSKGEIYFLDMVAGEINNYFSNNNIINYRNKSHYTEVTFTYFNNPAKLINDLDGDNYYDFYQVVLNEQFYTFELKKIRVNENGATYDFPIQIDGFFRDFYYEIGDIDNDQIVDYGIVMGQHDRIYLHIISSKTGEELINIVHKSDEFYYMSNVDLNGDGIKEMFKVTELFNLVANVELYDISTGFLLELFSITDYNINYDNFIYASKPANTFIKDDRVYLAISVTDGYGEEINLYDLYSNPYFVEEKIEVAKFSNPKNKKLGSIHIYQKDGITYFHSQIGYIDQYNKEDLLTPPKTNVYDYTNKKVYCFYNNWINKLSIKDDYIYIRNADALVIIGEVNQELKIKNLTNNQRINSNYQLNIENNMPGELYIYVDDILVAITSEQQVDLQLFSGNHEITVTHVSEAGVATTYSVSVIVQPNTILSIAVVLTTVLLFTVLLLLTRRKSEVPNPLK